MVELAAAPVLGVETVSAFKNTLRGDLLQPGDTGYDEARAVWNGMTDKRPGLIVKCAGPSDVIKAVNLAREHGLRRSAGRRHSVVRLSAPARARRDHDRPVAHEECARDSLHTGRRAPKAARAGAISIEKPKPLVWPQLAARIGTPASLGSPWAVALAGFRASTACPATTCVSRRGHRRRGTPHRQPAENPDLYWGLRGGGGNFGGRHVLRVPTS